MGRNSSGNRGTKDGGGDYKGKITNVGPLVEMTNQASHFALSCRSGCKAARG